MWPRIPKKEIEDFAQKKSWKFPKRQASAKKRGRREERPEGQRRREGKGEKKKNIPEPAAASASGGWRTPEGCACGGTTLEGDASVCARRGRMCWITTNRFSVKERVRRKERNTDNFPRTQISPPPSTRSRGAAIEILSAHTIAQLRRRVFRMHDLDHARAAAALRWASAR